MSSGAAGQDGFAALTRQAFELLDAATPELHQFFFTPLGISAHARRAFVERCLHLSQGRRAAGAFRMPPIPRVVHRIWLTDPADPHFPPERFLQRIARQAADLSGSCGFLFWSNSDAVLRRVEAETRRPATEPPPQIQFKSIDALSDDPVHARIALAIAAKKYVLAGDILKYLLIARFGGIYADLGVDFRSKLVEAVMGSDVALYLSHDLFFQPAFMAAPPLAPPFQLFRKLLLRPEVLAALCVDPAEQNLSAAEIWTHGGLGFTAALMLFFDESYDILPTAPTPGLLHVESLRSWYGDADSFGGVKLHEAKATHIDVAKSAALASRLETLRYGSQGPAAARLKLIAGLTDAFMLDRLG